VIKNILFDLDGTLLPMDVNKFMKLYFKGLMEVFPEVHPQILHMTVMEGTKAMVEDSSDRTNLDVFASSFTKTINMDETEVMNRFFAYYETDFKKVKDSTWVSKHMIEAVQVLKDKGYRLFIATNPMFPLVANQERISWANLKFDDFEYVSSLEKNHYCKPNLKFYEEFLIENKLDPQDCLMVGNDTFEDMIITRMNVKTYLVTDCQIDDNDIRFKSDYSGTSQEFLDFVKLMDPII
jgi:FMN phosphatase YigB (HAD superfamily)